MFANQVTYSPFADNRANAVFANVQRVDWVDNDIVLVSTIRALLYSRTKERFCVSEEYGGELKVEKNRLKVIFLTEYDFGECERRVDGVELKAINDFLKEQKLKFKCFTNMEGDGGMIVMPGTPLRIRHVSLFFIPRLIPAFFKDQPINEKEKQLLFSLKEDTEDKYKSIIEEIASGIDIDGEFVRSSLHGFANSQYETRLSYLRNEISELEDEIRNLREQMHSSIVNRQHMIDESSALDEKIHSNASTSDDELINFFLENKNTIDVMEVGDGDITFMVKTVLQSWNDDDMERVIDNGQAFHMEREPLPEFWTKERIEKFVRSVFLPTKLRVKTIGWYSLSTRYNEVGTRRGFGRDGKYQDYIQNPHLRLHGCLGDHEEYINDALQSGDIELAVMQCVESAKSINPLEMDVTFRPFLRSVMADDHKIILLPDGQSVTPKEAMEWLEKEETMNETH